MILKQIIYIFPLFSGYAFFLFRHIINKPNIGNNNSEKLRGLLRNWFWNCIVLFYRIFEKKVKYWFWCDGCDGGSEGWNWFFLTFWWQRDHKKDQFQRNIYYYNRHKPIYMRARADLGNRSVHFYEIKPMSNNSECQLIL